MTVGLAEVRAAARELDGVVKETPLLDSRVLSEAVGVDVLLKAENLQRTGSFKVRGAYVRMSRLTADEKARGVVAASAGNHAQGVALAAALLGIRAVIFMPVDAALPKVAATREHGAEVRLVGLTVDDALVAAHDEAERTGAVFIHPFDHPDVVAGQGTLGLDVLAQCPDVRTVLVPMGGGGLVAGVAAALAEAAPHVRVVAVQASQVASYGAAREAGHVVSVPVRPTMADGIAVGRTGQVPFELLDRLGVDVVGVSEDDLSRALLLVAERAKLLVEPAGAAGVAALLAAADRGDSPFEGPVVAVLSGGNVDPVVLLRVIRHGLVAAGRYLQLRIMLDDRPGSLARLLEILAVRGCNIMHIDHGRTDVGLSVDTVAVRLQVETKGPGHQEEVVAALREAGYALVAG
ncbi:threonine ammonia-lyase [Luteimicrobium subarcticum]|uniref:threonine ammonia-lyase n=1 Tax=Luteimicrobium subarcticum TaxID=620910 RepID=A0A2M8WTF6_9MICO|nr:threonine ammonia-lyase [Luteimicrobium subarcticum]PJI94168.1 threonine dehydratase [Luteimicrobium subarcticum]